MTHTLHLTAEKNESSSVKEAMNTVTGSSQQYDANTQKIQQTGCTKYFADEFDILAPLA